MILPPPLPRCRESEGVPATFSPVSRPSCTFILHHTSGPRHECNGEMLMLTDGAFCPACRTLEKRPYRMSERIVVREVPE